MISIVSAIHKSERYLPSFLKHVQKFAGELLAKGVEFEVIIVPTNSSQKEKELLLQVKKEPWCVVREFNHPGLYAAWNEGFGLARGDVMGPWNVDDVRFAGAAIEAEELVKKGAHLVYFPFFIKRYLSFGLFSLPVFTSKVEGEVLKFERRKFQIHMTAGPHFMFTKEAFNKVGPFDEQFKIAADFDWCARAAQMSLNFALGKEFSGIFRVDGRGLSAGKNKRREAENNIIYLRQEAEEFLIPGVETEMAQYRPWEILHNGIWQPFKK